MAIASISIFRGFSITLCLSRSSSVSKMSNSRDLLNYCLCAETQYAKFCVHPFKVVSLFPYSPLAFMYASLVGFQDKMFSGHIPRAGSPSWRVDMEAQTPASLGRSLDIVVNLPLWIGLNWENIILDCTTSPTLLPLSLMSLYLELWVIICASIQVVLIVNL